MIFAGHDATDNIGSPTQMMNIEDFHERLQMRREQPAGVSYNENDFSIGHIYNFSFFVMNIVFGTSHTADRS